MSKPRDSNGRHARVTKAADLRISIPRACLRMHPPCFHTRIRKDVTLRAVRKTMFRRRRWRRTCPWRSFKVSSTLTVLLVVMLRLLMLLLLMMMMDDRRINLNAVDRAWHPPAEHIRNHEVGLDLHQRQQAILDLARIKGHRSPVRITARPAHQKTTLSTEDVVVAPAKVTG